MQSLVTVGFWPADPVAEPVGLRKISVSDYRVDIPAGCLFGNTRQGIKYDSDSQNIVNLFERHILRLHFGPYGKYRFRTTGYFEFQARFIELVYNGETEFIDE